MGRKIGGTVPALIGHMLTRQDRRYFSTLYSTRKDRAERNKECLCREKMIDRLKPLKSWENLGRAPPLTLSIFTVISGLPYLRQHDNFGCGRILREIGEELK